MKNAIKALTAGIAVALLSMTTSAQNSAPMVPSDQGGKMPAKFDTTQVPKEVKVVYITEYPTVTMADWYGYPVFTDESGWYDYDRDLYTTNSNNAEYYIVEFDKDATPNKIIYTKKGKKVASHKHLKNVALPPLVNSSFNNSKYKSWNVVGDKVEIIKEADKSKVYKIKVEKGKEVHTLFYSDKGKLLKDKTSKM